MPTRFVPPAALVVLAAALVALAPAQEPRSIYRDGFAGREPSFVRGDANVKFEEKDHKVSGEHAKSGTTWVQQIVSQLIFAGPRGCRWPRCRHGSTCACRRRR